MEPRAWRAAEGDGDGDEVAAAVLTPAVDGFLVAVDMAANRCGEP
jgi:hypothetical protein